MVISAFFISHTTSSTTFRWSQYSGDISTTCENDGTFIRGMLKNLRIQIGPWRRKERRVMQIQCIMQINARSYDNWANTHFRMFLYDGCWLGEILNWVPPFPFIPFPFTIHFSNSWEKRVIVNRTMTSNGHTSNHYNDRELSLSI